MAACTVSPLFVLLALLSYNLCCLHCFPIICAAKTALLLDTLCSHKSCFYALTASHMCYHYYLQLRTSTNTYNFSQTLLCSYNFSQAQTVYNLYIQLLTSTNNTYKSHKHYYVVITSHKYEQSTTCTASPRHNYLLGHDGCCGGERRSLWAALCLCFASWAGKAGLPLHSC